MGEKSSILSAFGCVDFSGLKIIKIKSVVLTLFLIIFIGGNLLFRKIIWVNKLFKELSTYN